MRTSRWALLIIAALAAPAFAGSAEWAPSKPLRLIVPFPPGGSADLLGRTIAAPLGTALGQQVVVDNRGGAGGVIAMDLVAHALPDGYTMGLPSLTAHAGNATLQAKLPYDSVRDFQPLTFVARSALTLIVNGANPATSVKDLIARARGAGKPIAFGSSGVGIANHVSGELMGLSTAQEKVRMTHVPYKGGGPAMVDLMAGNIDMMFNPVSSVLGLVQSKKLKALAVADQKRSRAFPDVPTMTEQGFANFYMLESWGVVVPAQTPPQVAQRLRNELVKILQQPELVERYGAQGLDIAPSSPEELRQFMIAEINKYRDIIKRANIKI